jgi:hypothetical protein
MVYHVRFLQLKLWLSINLKNKKIILSDTFKTIIKHIYNLDISTNKRNKNFKKNANLGYWYLANALKFIRNALFTNNY